MDKSVRGLVVLLGLAGFIVMADNWVVSPILPAIARSVGVTPESAGLLIAAYMLPFGVFQLVFGPLADRFGKQRVVLVTFVAFAVVTALCAVGSTLYGVAALRALTGLFAAATMPISLAMIADATPLQTRQAAIGSFMGIAFLGQALSMGIGGAIAFYLDWRGVFITYGLLAGVIAIALARGISSRSWQPSVKTDTPGVLKPYRDLISHGPSRRTYLVILTEGIFLLGSFSYLGAVLDRRFGLSFLAIGAVMTLFGAGAIVGGRVSAKIAGRIGKTRTIAVGLALAALADALVFAGTQSLALTAVGVLFLGLGFMTAHSSLITVATEFAANARGTAMSLVTFAFMVGGAFGTQAGGRIAEQAGFGALYGFYGAALLLLGAVSLAAVTSPEADETLADAGHVPEAQAASVSQVEA